MRNAIVAYADEMANALCKSAYNMMIYEVRDYCCGLIDTEARMISQNRGGLPIFLADLGVAVADGIERYGLDGFAPGDVVIMNQGEVCGQHLNNVVRLFALLPRRTSWSASPPTARTGSTSAACARASARHDRPTSSPKGCRCARSRSTRPASATRRCGRSSATTSAIRTRRSATCARRSPPASSARRRYAELIARYGRETVEACIAKVWDQAEAAARAVVETIPDGDYEAESFLDNDGRTLDKPLRVKVKVSVAARQMTVDFSEMNPQVPSPLNSGRSGGIAGARVAFKALTSPDSTSTKAASGRST